MLHFIWLFTVCQSTRLGGGRIQRVEMGDTTKTSVIGLTEIYLKFLETMRVCILSLAEPYAQGVLLCALNVRRQLSVMPRASSSIASKYITS